MLHECIDIEVVVGVKIEKSKQVSKIRVCISFNLKKLSWHVTKTNHASICCKFTLLCSPHDALL